MPPKNPSRRWRKWPFVVLAIFAFGALNEPEKPASDAKVYGWQSEAPPGRIVTTPGPSYRDLEVADFKWSLQGFGNIMMLDSVTVKNKSAVAWKDVAIACELYGKSGTKIGSTFRVVYDVVPASGRKKFRELNMGFVNGQTAKAGCEIVTAARAG
ncbi:MAG: hypothetical protein C0519_01350 [Hyphomicrobium sp.]|nr:hypothetical protein [Hyphomicrobium sp.]